MGIFGKKKQETSVQPSAESDPEFVSIRESFVDSVMKDVAIGFPSIAKTSHRL